MSPVHVVLAGGGTAGHVEPALNLADCLRRHDPSVGITALGTERGLETRLVPERGYDLRLITATPMPRRPTLDLARLPTRVRRAVSEVRQVLDDTEADVLVGFGGYVALPGYLGARGRTPIAIHEANARPGLANKVGARFTAYVGCAVPGAIDGARHIGMPLRPSIADLDRAAARAAARAFFGLEPDRPTLLAFGGSQGARRLNDAVVDAAPGLTAQGIQVLHAAGLRNDDQRPTASTGPAPYIAVPYIDRMDLAYAAADVALCRAGAMTCAELAAVGLPALYVPLPIGNGEQRLNALPVVDAGGGLLVDDAALDGERVLHVLGPLLLDEEQRRAMETAAASHGQRDADERLRRLVLDAVAGAGAATAPGGAR
ncbi:MAG TPA: undecaprenyldiphospho-muramoylpentapeptide beta-N-acetylglucosaminyltransferase [Candidatus Nanopelagicales bacterium]|nr:undecaprenyldiphospho-muramoylpentapeptide beta-N-acetylglucosaminyltransferase [Candidatus Nanopelagicales bacterium]